MELEANYGILNWADGKQHRALPPGLAVEMSPSKAARGRDRDLFFVHLTLNSRDSSPASLYQNVVDELVQAFFESSGSVTAAMRKAIRAGNELLMRHNLRIEGVDKQQGAITCAVLREEEIFIAQSGMTLGYICHQGQLERLPPRRPGLITPLGVGYGVDTRFYHSWVHPGDVLLLADADFPGSQQEVGNAIIYEGVSSGINNLVALCKSSGTSGARLLLAEFTAFAPAVASPKREPHTVPTQEKFAEPELAPEFEPHEELEDDWSEPEDDWSESDNDWSEPAVLENHTTKDIQEPFDKVSPSPKRVEVEETARKTAYGITMGLSRLASGISQMIGKLFGGEPVEGQAVRKDGGASPLVLGIFAVLIPVVVALVAVTVYMQRGERQQFANLLLQMERESNIALAADTPVDQRNHWMQVLAISDDALALRPGSETVLLFCETAYEKLDVLDQITRLRVHNLYDYGENIAPDRVSMQKLNAYVLDSAKSTVYKHLLGTEFETVEGVEPDTILFKNQAVGDDAVGQLVDLSWFPASGQIKDDSIVILDEGGLMLRYLIEKRSVYSSDLALPDTWKTPIASTVYGDSYYVLDIGAGQIWRFESKDNGYPDPPTIYRFIDNEDANLTNDIDISQMIDIAIDRDGNLYLLRNDGQVQKYYGGERKPFAFTDLEQPLVAPVSIYCSVTGLNPMFYIADPGSGRIVQTTQQGLFMSQYRARGTGETDPFSQITDIYVQETPVLAIYATSGNNLIAAGLE